MKVKWNSQVSSERGLNGGGAQGGLLGIMEYLSQTNDNVDFLVDEVKFKFIDDLSVSAVINLAHQCISSYTANQHVSSHLATNNQYLPPSNFKSQGYLDEINSLTDDHQMRLNVEK